MAILFTKEGYNKTKSDLDDAKRKRPEAVATLARARAMGDLSENGFYKGARFELNDLDRKIRHLTRLVEEGRVIEKPTSNDTVQVGHTVILKRIA
jgi:transcription elongation GreA/GreB family factor